VRGEYRDGAGILLQVPDKFLRRECGLGIALPPAAIRCGMVFLPRDPRAARPRPVPSCTRIVTRRASTCSAGARFPPTAISSGPARSR